MIGRRLKELRYNHNRMTQAELAEKLGVSQQAIGAWETGKSTPENKNIMQIAKIFNVSLDELMGTPFAGQKPGQFLAFYDQAQPIPPQKKIPVVGTVKCGVGGIAFEDYDGYVAIDEDMHGDFIAFRCRGDSMINEGIIDGDIAIVRLQDEVESGSLAVVIVNGEEGTLKRIYYNEGNITLMSANPAYPPRVFTGESMNTVKIVGRVIETRRKR